MCCVSIRLLLNVSHVIVQTLLPLHNLSVLICSVLSILGLLFYGSSNWISLLQLFIFWGNILSCIQLCLLKAFEIDGIYTPSDPHEHSYHGAHTRTSAARPVTLAHFQSSDPLITRVMLSNYLISFWMRFHRTSVAVDCANTFTFHKRLFWFNSLLFKSQLFGRKSICCYCLFAKWPSIRVSKKSSIQVYS